MSCWIYPVHLPTHAITQNSPPPPLPLEIYFWKHGDSLNIMKATG